jgi:hypothetical protein
MGRRFKLMGLCAFAGVLAAGPAFAACSGKPTFQDTFQTLDPSWGQADKTLSVANGSLIVQPQPGYLRWVVSQSDYYGDGSICVQASIAEASAIDQAQALVLFWVTDYSNMYVLNIGSDGKQGYYKVDRASNGRWLTPISWTPDPAIKFQLGDMNQVEVQMLGHVATIFVNGKKMTQFNGTPPDNGALIGVGGGAGNGVTAKLTFQNFEFFKAASP